MKNIYDEEIDEQELQEMYRTDPRLRALMDFLGTQGKDDRLITVSELCDQMGKAGIVVWRTDIIRMLQSLNGGNRGVFTIGRRGQESRFEFFVSSRTLAKVASGKDVSKTSAAAILTHKFRLRADLEISLQLPADLSDKEVRRISDFLKTLPFDHAGLRQAA